MTTIFFDELKIGQSFIFRELVYIKTSNDKGLSLAGSRMFNPKEIVSL